MTLWARRVYLKPKPAESMVLTQLSHISPRGVLYRRWTLPHLGQALGSFWDCWTASACLMGLSPSRAPAERLLVGYLSTDRADKMIRGSFWLKPDSVSLTQFWL